MREIGFRRLAEDDLPLLFNWLSRPHVKRWYAPQPASFPEMAAKYRPRTEEGNAVKAFVFTVDGADAGYIQCYAIDEFPDYARRLGCERGVVGIDLFVGDDWRTRRGLGPRVIRRFVDEKLFGEQGVQACVAGPVEGNEASIRAFEKAGFRRWKVVENERGERECVMRLDREAPYRIATIDLADADTCARFHRDMYLAAFGTEAGLAEEMGTNNEHYLAQLRAKIAELPEGNAHLWHGDCIVGQTEMRLLEDEPQVGYVSLLYVVPELRGRGLGRMLHDHAVEIFRRRGKRVLRLSVSTHNEPAIRFYSKLGWRIVGSRPNLRPMHVMELPIT